MSPERVSPADAGCWIDGHWGQYAVSRMVDIAASLGYGDSEVIALAIAYSAGTLGIDEAECFMEAAEEVEEWLNEEVAPAGHRFEWVDGEFFLSLVACPSCEEGTPCEEGRWPDLCWGCVEEVHRDAAVNAELDRRKDGD